MVQPGQAAQPPPQQPQPVPLQQPPQQITSTVSADPQQQQQLVYGQQVCVYILHLQNMFTANVFIMS